MSSRIYYKVPSLLSSQEGESGANRLLERLHNGSISMDVRPNSYPKYSGKLEEDDFLAYCRFLSSSNGKKVIKKLEVQDAGKLCKL